MKAVIVEIRGETAAALGRDGSVFKVKNHAYAVGQTIDVRRGGFSRQLAVLAAAAAAVFLIVGAGIHTYLSPYSLVSLDVNPSLQYTLNRLGLVLSVEAVNGDGDELLQEVGTLNNRSIEDAISITVKQIAEDGYFDGDEPGGMVIAASSHDEQEAARLAENAKETALRATQESEKKSRRRRYDGRRGQGTGRQGARREPRKADACRAAQGNGLRSGNHRRERVAGKAR